MAKVSPDLLAWLIKQEEKSKSDLKRWNDFIKMLKEEPEKIVSFLRKNSATITISAAIGMGEAVFVENSEEFAQSIVEGYIKHFIEAEEPAKS